MLDVLFTIGWTDQIEKCKTTVLDVLFTISWTGRRHAPLGDKEDTVRQHQKKKRMQTCTVWKTKKMQTSTSCKEDADRQQLGDSQEVPGASAQMWW